MSEPVAISDDALKLLVAEHGVRGTARLLNLDERQTMAFRQRAQRGKWMQDPAIIAIRKQSGPPVVSAARPIVSTVSPQAALAAEIHSLGQKTRLSLARGIAKAGEHIESMDGQEIVMDAQNVKSVAQTADLVHGWRDSAPQVRLRLDVLPSGSQDPVIDVSAEAVSPSDEWASDDVDDY